MELNTPQNNTPSWVQDNFVSENNALKLSAFKEVQLKGFPSTKLEDWKYTNVASIVKTNYQSANKIDDLKISAAAQGLRLVFLNGRLSEKLSELSKLKDLGVQIESLAESKTAKEHFAKYALADSSSFVALNTALNEETAVITIKANLELNQAVELVYFNSGKDVVVNPRLLLEVGDNSKFILVERFIGEGSYLNNYVAEIVIGKNAKVDHYKLQEESLESSHFSRVEVRQQAGSNYENHVFNFGAKLARNEINPVLAGERIYTLLHGLNILNADQHVDNQTILDHAKPNCDSREWYKGIYADKSKGVFSGTIIVRQDAQKTNAFQSNQSLLLSEDAESNSKPQLKIWADDVKCSHGATVGQLDQDALFYLRSRGVPLKTAQAILINAFAGDILNPVKIASLKEEIEAKILSKLSSK